MGLKILVLLIDLTQCKEINLNSYSAWLRISNDVTKTNSVTKAESLSLSFSLSYCFIYVVKLYERLLCFCFFIVKFYFLVRSNYTIWMQDRQRDRDKEINYLYYSIPESAVVISKAILTLDLLYKSNYYHILKFVACRDTK